MPERPQSAAYVLILEDEERNIELLSRIFRRDLRIWVARTADEARKILAENRVDVVLADHQLPGESGVSLLRDVAKNNPKTCRILITAFGGSDEVVRATEDGTIERFFIKPYSPSRIHAAVLELLRQRGLFEAHRVLVADDDPTTREILCSFLMQKSISAEQAPDGEQAIERLSGERFEAAVVDLSMPKVDGIGVLRHVRATDPDLPVLILTGATPSMGLNLLESGAFDFMSKPVRRDEFLMRVERAILARQQSEDHQRLLHDMESARKEQRIVAESPAMKRVIGQAQTVASHDVGVLVMGETGTGKEVIAHLIHRTSRRAEGPFIPINCGALPENLVESELFGHERGAFTDAKDTKIGIFESADGGTVFLDEVGELSPQSQVRLLRVLESKEVTRVGSTKPIKVDVRVIAATHRNLKSMVEEGRFRQDLYYRLNGFEIDIPPLRDRPEDLLPLIESAASSFCLRNNIALPEVSPRALQEAQDYGWPGNVRELLHVVERTLITHGPRRIEKLEVDRPSDRRKGSVFTFNEALPMKDALEPVFEKLEMQYLTRVLALCGGHLSKAAEHAGIHRKSLYNKMKRYGMSRPRGAGADPADGDDDSNRDLADAD